MRLIVCILATLFSLQTWAQNDTAYVYTYGGNRDDRGRDLIETPDGGYLILGSKNCKIGQCFSMMMM